MESRDGNGTEGGPQVSDKVIRLPREWLGPPEELVPLGSRARALREEAEAQAAAEETAELPASASSFWTEDSGSVQAPMQRPADPWEPAAEASMPPAAHVPRRP